MTAPETRNHDGEAGRERIRERGALSPPLAAEPGAAWASAAGWPALDPREIAANPPDAHRVIRGGDGAPLARCSLWWSRTPTLAGERVGLIGHWASSGDAAARHLLAHACAELAASGCSLAVGPMDGSTWRRYRFATWSSEEPEFFLEPTNPRAWPLAWADSGFSPLADYVSTLGGDLTREEPRASEAAARLGRGGVRLRTLDMSRFDEELRRIHAVVSTSFAPSLLFTPISADAMAAQYEALRPAIVPGLVVLAEQEERLVGFCFCLPDHAERARDGTTRTAILKTLAVLPHREPLAGLGSHLVSSAHLAMHAHGFTRVIHALMHVRNPSLRISARTTQPIRRYALFARSLA